jgi:hypothetical protein
MRTRLLKLSCEQPPKGKLQYFLTVCADVSQGGSSYGGLGCVRISKRTAEVLLRWDTADRTGSQALLATLMVTIP